MAKDEFDFWKDKLTGCRSVGLFTDRCPKCKSDLEFKGREEATKEFWYYRYELICHALLLLFYLHFINHGK